MINNTTQLFNWVDYTILVIITLSTLVGVFRGFIKEAVSLLVWVAAIFVAIKFFPLLGQYLNKHYIESLTMSNVFAFIALFIITLILGLIVNVIVSVLVEKTGLTATDRLLGVVFGLARGILLVAILLLFVNLSAFYQNKAIEKSALVPTFKPVMRWLSKFLPKSLEKSMNSVEPLSSPSSSKKQSKNAKAAENVIDSKS